MSTFTVWTFLNASYLFWQGGMTWETLLFFCQWTKMAGRHSLATLHLDTGLFEPGQSSCCSFLKWQKFDWINGDLKGLGFHQRIRQTSRIIVIECKICQTQASDSSGLILGSRFKPTWFSMKLRTLKMKNHPPNLTDLYVVYFRTCMTAVKLKRNHMVEVEVYERNSSAQKQNETSNDFYFFCSNFHS